MARRRHLVHVGDSWQSIAREYYGDASHWQRIFNANAQRVKTPENLTPGTELVIPD